MKWNILRHKLSFLMAILIAVQAIGLIPASSAASSDVNLIANGSFEAPHYSNSNFNMIDASSNTSIMWKTSAPDNQIEVWSMNFKGIPAYEGTQHAELNANYASTLYQDINTTPGQVLVWRLAHRGKNGTDGMKLQLAAPSAFTKSGTTLTTPEISSPNISYTKTTTDAVSGNPVTTTLSSPYSNTFTMDDGMTWGRYEGYYIVPEGQTVTRFAFTAVYSSNGQTTTGNMLDDIFFGTVGSPPVASNVDIAGTVKIGATVSGSYTYSDIDGDAESVTGSVYQWYIGNESDGSDKQPIAGASGLNYTIAKEDYGKYLFFEVTPTAQTGTPTGMAVVSSGSLIEDNPPVASSVAINGTLLTGQTVSGSYIYSDIDGDAESVTGSVYQWYIGNQSDGSDKQPIAGASGLNYTIAKEDSGKYLFFEVTPKAETGTSTGTAVVSSGSLIGDVPTEKPATISGILRNGSTNEPLRDTMVRVTGNGFDQTIQTDDNGAYSVTVPGNAEYTLTFTQTVSIGGVDTKVTFTQKAQVDATATEGQSTPATKTAAGVVLYKQPDGQTALFDSSITDKLHVYLKDANGNYVSENNAPKAFSVQNGVFVADGLSIGDYTMEIRYEAEPGKELAFAKPTTISIQANGEMNITTELVDPYGSVTDAVTGSALEGATVTLYYADTQRNKDNGRAPGTEVTLPTIAGFAPHDNMSPTQSTDVHGSYAYMVYPEADYYLVVSKPGYVTQTTETIPVEYDIVQKDIQLQPISSSGGGGGAAPIVTADRLGLTLTSDKNLVEEGDTSAITANYKNLSSGLLAEGTVTVQLPVGVTVVNADGGTVDGNTITWAVKNLSAGTSGAFQISVKWPQLTASEAEFSLTGEFKALGDTASGTKATSNALIKVYSTRFGDLQHQRYILGYPDGQFKPARSLTRAELAAIIARLSGNVTVANPLRFSDVNDSYWAKDYIDTATGLGYFTGYSDGTFHPDQAVTRGELAAVMARFLKVDTSATSTTHFTDLDGHWAQNTIEALYGNHFLSGYPDNTFKPDKAIVRTEAVTLINRMLYRGPLQGLPAQFPDVTASYWAFGEVQEATVSHQSERNADGSETWTQSLEDQVK